MFDVIIIGAGPAGTIAAYELLAGGLSVLVLDRRNFPRKKACAGGITPKALSLFPYDISHLILRTCTRVRVTGPGGRSFFVRGRAPLCHMVQRRDLDHFSLNQVMAAGGKFSVIDRILSIKDLHGKRFAKVTVLERGKPRTYASKFIIGADGANSGVRHLLEKSGSCRPFAALRKYPALEADVNLPDADKIPMEFDFSKKIPGYYWIFPRDDHVNIGIFSTRHSPAINRQELAAYARERFGTDVLKQVKGYPIATMHPGPRRYPVPGAGRVLLAGDAAGLAEPMLGEGIYPALKSGRLAAQAIRKARHDGRSSALKSYHQSLSGLRLDAALAFAAARALYRCPELSLSLGTHKTAHGIFARGYAKGRPISRIVFPFMKHQAS